MLGEIIKLAIYMADSLSQQTWDSYAYNLTQSTYLTIIACMYYEQQHFNPDYIL